MVHFRLPQLDVVRRGQLDQRRRKAGVDLASGIVRLLSRALLQVVVGAVKLNFLRGRLSLRNVARIQLEWNDGLRDDRLKQEGVEDLVIAERRLLHQADVVLDLAQREHLSLG